MAMKKSLLINTLGGKKHVFKHWLLGKMPYKTTYHNQDMRRASRLAAGLCETSQTTEGTTYASITSSSS